MQIQKEQRRTRLSPFDALLKDPYDKEAWRELFGNKLDRKICHVVITEHGTIRVITWKNGYRQEVICTRKGIAYC